MCVKTTIQNSFCSIFHFWQRSRTSYVLSIYYLIQSVQATNDKGPKICSPIYPFAGVVVVCWPESNRRRRLSISSHNRRTHFILDCVHTANFRSNSWQIECTHSICAEVIFSPFLILNSVFSFYFSRMNTPSQCSLVIVFTESLSHLHCVHRMRTSKQMCVMTAREWCACVCMRI